MRDPSDLLRKPIVGDDGVNPFAEPGAKPEAADAASERAARDNVYAAPGQAGGQPIYRPQGYTPTLVPHSRRVLILGVLGLVVSIGCLAAFDYFISLPVALANLGLTIGAWMLGRNELKAIDAGAVEGSDRGQARLGMILGIVATLVSLSAAGIFLYRNVVQPMMGL
jgi:hypothetical protein